VLVLGSTRSGRSGTRNTTTLGRQKLRSECEEAANANVNHPYGTAPTVGMAQIAGHTACFIIPSGDAAAQRARSGGPVFRLASLVVRYRRSVTLGGVDYPYLVVTCDTAHLWQIATTIEFSAGH
jgi:hypothetical protein